MLLNLVSVRCTYITWCQNLWCQLILNCIYFRGQNPLHVLAQYGKENAAAIFDLFLECMPKYPIDKPDANGNTGMKFNNLDVSLFYLTYPFYCYINPQINMKNISNLLFYFKYSNILTCPNSSHVAIKYHVSVVYIKYSFQWHIIYAQNTIKLNISCINPLISVLIFIYFTALLLAYVKGHTNLCKAIVRSGARLGALNREGLSIFNAPVATKQLLVKLLGKSTDNSL